MKQSFIHLADLHCNKDRKDKCIEVLSYIFKFIVSCEIQPKLLISGDFFDCNISNSENSGFTDFLSAMRQLSEITDVYMIYGTPSHEVAGSLECFKPLGVNVYSKNTFEEFYDWQLVAIPEPRKTDYVSKTNINKAIKDDLVLFCEKTSKACNPDKPVIVMYHGDIEGAILQNGETINSTPDNYAMPRKALKNLNADYYAFGHVHLYQQIDYLNNAYYAGSAYQKNFGELHKPSFNYIEFDDKKVDVKRIYLPFPVNKTVEVNLEDLNNLKKNNYEDTNLKVVINIEKSLKKNFSVNDIAEEIKESTKASFVKVMFNYIKPSNNKDKSVTECHSVVDKFKAYTDLNQIKVTKKTLDKVQEIEDSIISESLIPCDSFELESLSLRGAIGIKDGIGKEQIDIDFTQYTDILAIIGHNGAGKTTIIENCHPYPQMLTRSGSLKDHFYLKDSHRILVYKGSNGNKIRITMQIDGSAKCVMTRYFVEQLKGENWEAIRAVDGTSESYKQWVNQTFGSLEIFLRTSFYANGQKKSVPDLSIATKTEKMELFSVLAGTDYLTKISDIAKEKIKSLKNEIDDTKSELKDFDNIKEKISTYTISLSDKSQEVDKYKELVKIDTKELDIYKKEQEKFIKFVVQSEFLRKELVAKNNEHDELTKKLEDCIITIQGLNERLDELDTYQEQLNWYEENIVIKKDLETKLANLQTDIAKAQNSLNTAIDSKSFLQESYSVSNTILNELNLKLKTLKNSVVTDLKLCPVCKKPLDNMTQKQLEEEQKEIADKTKEVESEIKDREAEVNKTLKEIEDLKINDLRKEYQGLVDEQQSYLKDLGDISLYMNDINVEEIKDILNTTKPLLKDKEEEKINLKDKISNLEKEIKSIEAQQKEIPADYSDKILRLERGIEDSRTNISNLNAEITLLKSELDILSKSEEKVAEINSRIKVLQADVKDYDIIANAFSNNGIQAIELDSAAPEISDITNNILHETYGDRFTVSFETERESSSGNKKISDFVINVFDAEKGRIKRLDLLSTGESLWIKQALYFAFSVLRSRRSGFCFRTRFLDESDSSLDEQARVLYYKMILAAHKACDATLTIIITHSPELKELIQQKIELT